MIAYKVFIRRTDHSLGPLFIEARRRVPLNKWVRCNDNVKPPSWISNSRKPGWHAKTTLEAARRLASYDKRRRVFRVELRGNIKVNGRGLVTANWLRVLEEA